MKKPKFNYTKIKIILIVAISNTFLILITSYFWYKIIKNSLFEKLQYRLDNIVTLWTKIIDADIVEEYIQKINLNLTENEILTIENQERYKKLFDSIDFIKNIQPDFIKYTYILIPTENENITKFLIDSDIYIDREREKKWEINEDEWSIAYFWWEYDISEQIELKQAIKNKEKTITTDFIYDKEWDIYSLMWFHPLFSTNNDLLWFLWVDITDDKYFNSLNNIKTSFLFIIWINIIISIFFSIYLSNIIFKFLNLLKRESNLKETNYKLNEIYNQKNNFLSITSHQIKIPLISVIWHIKMILEWSFWKISNDIKNNLEDIHFKLKNLVLLTEDIIDITKIESWDNNIFEDFNLVELLKTIENNFSNIYNKKNINYSFFSEINWYWNIYSCKYSIKKIINNLLSNAIKFTNTWWEISVLLKEDWKHYIIDFIDNWIWIEKKDIDKIFNNFISIWWNKNNIDWYTWLGLSIVKELLINLKWKIEIKSEIWIWSTFTIILPKNI